MASAIEKSVREATDELHARKVSEGVSVNGVSGDEREIEDIQHDVEGLESSQEGIFSRIRSFLSRSGGSDVTREPGRHEVPDIDFKGLRDIAEEAGSKGEIGDTESLDRQEDARQKDEDKSRQEPDLDETAGNRETPGQKDSQYIDLEMDMEGSRPLGGPEESGVDEDEEEAPETRRVDEEPPEGNDRKEQVKRELRDLEQKIVDEESRELAKLQELEQRIEQLEMKDRQGLRQRMDELEDRLETIKSPKELDDRMTELENVVMNPERNIEELVGQDFKADLKETKQILEDEKERLEAEIERLGEDQGELEESFQQLRDSVERLRSDFQEIDSGQVENEDSIQELDDKLEQLWEAMDNEFVSMENQVHENEAEVEELLSTILELSEFVKQAMDQ